MKDLLHEIGGPALPLPFTSDVTHATAVATDGLKRDNSQAIKST